MREELRPAAIPLVGETLSNAYRVIRLIGEGAMGGIYEARLLRLDKRVAIKVLARELAVNGEALLRFHREAEITSQLGHPHIISVFDFGTTEHGQPYLVMEYLEGEDLANRLGRKTALSLPATVRIAKQVASALAETHAKGVVHRDLKPANLFITRIQGEDFAKVLDFGISKVRAASTALTNAQTLMGTPMYMAPEQAKGESELDHLTDQWALACITYEMLAGRPPFQGDTAALLYQVVHQEPPRLSNFVEGSADRGRAGRPPRADQGAAGPLPRRDRVRARAGGGGDGRAASRRAGQRRRRARRRRRAHAGRGGADGRERRGGVHARGPETEGPQAAAGRGRDRRDRDRRPGGEHAGAPPRGPCGAASGRPAGRRPGATGAGEAGRRAVAVRTGDERQRADEPAGETADTDVPSPKPDKPDRARRRPARRAASAKQATTPPAPSTPVKRKLINKL